MKTQLSLITTLLLVTAHLADAHIVYSGRDFGVFPATSPAAPVVISNVTTSFDSGWAAGTSSRFGDSHKVRAFRFRLENAGTVTIEVVGVAFSTFTALEFPAFSLYSGLAHLPPEPGDHDYSPISTSWLNSTLGAGNWDGAFNALGDWKIGNDNGTTFADLSSFTYIGNAADGTSSNFGSAPGIHGDGLANGSVSRTFALAAGDYSIFVGGAKHGGTGTGPYTFTTTLTVVPEPAPIALISCAALVAFLVLKRRKTAAG